MMQHPGGQDPGWQPPLDRKEVDLEALEDLDDDAALAKLDELCGVGRWTAKYVLPG